ncbi:MAG: hypothetical protein SGJ24_04830 [Chloroflexota bacterium]|nr:hypothetical protein [Chloroflexota bacterium]
MNRRDDGSKSDTISDLADLPADQPVPCDNMSKRRTGWSGGTTHRT